MVLVELLDRALQRQSLPGLLQALHEIGGSGEQHPVAVLDERVAKSALRCDLPDPLGPNNRIVPSRSIHPSPAASAATCARLNGNGGKIETVEGFAGWQASLKQMSLDTSLIPFGELQVGERGEQKADLFAHWAITFAGMAER